MFKMYSKGCEYALRVLMCLSRDPASQQFSPVKICQQANVPESYTRKVLQTLAREGLLEAVSGPGGGYTLLAKPDDISLLRIIKSVDGEEAFDRCIMGLEACDDQQPCPVHHVWKKLRCSFVKELESRTLGELIHVREQRERVESD